MENTKIIQKKLKSIDKKLYIVGGFCREKILGNKNDGDVDIVTDATPGEMQEVLNVVGEVGKKYGTCIILEGEEDFELTTFRKDIGSINNRKPAEVIFTDSLEEDAKRRDFTCNAIYYNPETEELIDPENGKEDMEKNIIRFVGDINDRIKEDALRILRFIRFKNRYGFKVAEESYWDIIRDNLNLLEKLPVERVRQELDKMLLHGSNTQSLEDLKRIGFLDKFIPELSCLDKYPGNKHHLEGDVWIHTKMCVEEMNIITLREEGMTESRKLMLLWTILLHDIGKAETFTVGDDGESHYYAHENIGAEMFKKDLAKRLKFSNNHEKQIYDLIENHLRVFRVPNMKILKARKLMMEGFFDDLLLVGEADNKGRRPQKFEEYNDTLRIYGEFKKILKEKKFLTGEDIMDKYPDLEGKKIGERLEQLNNQVLVNDD